jgi:4-oxalocrotonate tautomerase
MPILNVKLCAPPSPALSKRVSEVLTQITVDTLGKRAELVAVTVAYYDAEHWFIGGQSLATQKKCSAYLDIKITDETNTRAEKARFIKAAFEALAETIGDLHPTSYICVDDVRATAWGYGGLTQSHRAHVV